MDMLVTPKDKEKSSGTDTLARFASHLRTRLLLLEIIKKQDVSIHLVDNCDQDTKESQQRSRNPLVILIDADDFDLYSSQFFFSKSRKAAEELNMYTGTTDSPDPSADPNVAFSDGASSNFVNVFKFFKSVWFFIYGI
ncbi:hypothetical protein EDC96DRAFT_573975 [Choanephora cucurbitarum]|nr:hypothetical protein EDC96DRAFT_573975 [Choanephora cucurbitarum]